MKKNLGIITLFLFISLTGFAQEHTDTTNEANWNFNTGLYFYFIPDDFFLLPIVKADKDKLHLEVRYNYEDMQTVSAWIGYNFITGEDWEFTITPMIAAVVGNSNGLAPGLELDLTYSSFELYTEAEYLFNFKDGYSNFFYNWAELTFSPSDWLWFGIVGQQTRVYQTELEIQRGLLLGIAYRNWQFTSYLFNIGYEDTFVMVSLTTDF